MPGLNDRQRAQRYSESGEAGSDSSEQVSELADCKRDISQSPFAMNSLRCSQLLAVASRCLKRTLAKAWTTSRALAHSTGRSMTIEDRCTKLIDRDHCGKLRSMLEL